MTEKLRYGAFALFLTACLLLCGCGGKKGGEAPGDGENKTEGASADGGSVLGGDIGILFPGEENEDLSAEAKEIRARLEDDGYKVEIAYAGENGKTQNKQMKKMIDGKKNCLIVTAVDPEAIRKQLARAAKQGITVIAYDRIVTGTDALSCYVGFDNRSMGEAVASYLVDNCRLDDAKAEKRVCTLEFFMGALEDDNSRMQLEGMMGILQEYMDTGVLQVRSLRTSYDDVSIVRESQDIARETCSGIMKANYMDNPVDVVCAGTSAVAGSVVDALKDQAGFQDDWPMVVGFGADRAAFKRLRDGDQNMLICTYREDLPKLCADLVDNEIQGRETKNLKTCDNGTAEVPALFGKTEIAYRDNYEQVMRSLGITLKKSGNKK